MIKFKTVWTAFALAIIAARGFANLQAAELVLRRDCECSGALVTLADVAEIYSNDKAQVAALTNIELFPAPTDGQSQMVPVRQIRDVLVQRGVDLRKVRLGGASAVTIRQEVREKHVTPVRTTTWKQRLQQQISDYLSDVEPGVEWNVTANVTGDLIRAMTAGERIIRVTGGRQPWVGSQRFTVEISDAGGTKEIQVIANVQRPFMVVVPVRPLGRGEVVRASDLQLQTVSAAGNHVNSLSSLEQAIGQEATRPLPAGRPLQRSDLQQAILVKRNNVVTVFVRSRGVQIRTSAKALEDGARDDVIKLQSLENRDDQFVARVTAFKEVEILAGAPRVEATPATPSPTPKQAPEDKNRLDATQRPSLFGLRVQGVEESN